MKLTSPAETTRWIYPARPTPEQETDEAAFAAFLESVRDFLRNLFNYGVTTRSYTDAVRFQSDGLRQEYVLRNDSEKSSREAISAITHNMVQRNKCDYVWDASSQEWVLRLHRL